MLEKFMKDYLLWEEECEEEGVTEATCDELTVTSISLTPVLLRRKRQRKLGVNLSPGIREVSREGV